MRLRSRGRDGFQPVRSRAEGCSRPHHCAGQRPAYPELCAPEVPVPGIVRARGPHTRNCARQRSPYPELCAPEVPIPGIVRARGPRTRNCARQRPPYPDLCAPEAPVPGSVIIETTRAHGARFRAARGWGGSARPRPHPARAHPKVRAQRCCALATRIIHHVQQGFRKQNTGFSIQKTEH
jgi:hypothetical protein